MEIIEYSTDTDVLCSIHENFNIRYRTYDIYPLPVIRKI
jgi:hypothetical protein